MTSMSMGEFAILRAKLAATIAAGCEASNGETLETVEFQVNRAIKIADAILENCELRGRG